VFDPKNIYFFSVVNFFQSHKYPGSGSGLAPGQYSARNAGFGSVSNEYGSETLLGSAGVSGIPVRV
jgi:hypothetical protein